MLRFNKTYFTLTLLLFITEVLIGVYLHDSIIRPYGGDLLVVILMYCFVRTFVTWPVKKTLLAVLLFAYTVEASQYFKLLVHLGLKQSKLANIILGNSFSWADILAYTLGVLLTGCVEWFGHQKATPVNTAV